MSGTIAPPAGPLTLASAAPSGIAIGLSYNHFQVNSVSGGVWPYTFVLQSGSLPAGTSLDSWLRRMMPAPPPGTSPATSATGRRRWNSPHAVERGITPDNPVRGVKRFPDRKGERFLSDAELARLGVALRDAAGEGVNPYALAIIKLLVFTGARKGEIEGLRWSEVDIDAGLLRLSDSKTGQKAILLNPPALEVLSGIERSEKSPYVFPASRSDGHFEGVVKVWQSVRKRAELQGVRLHDLRHSFASVAVANGASLPVIGALLGRGNATTTARYAHLSNDPLRAVNERIGSRLATALDKRDEDKAAG